jgi:hypothetical protein
MGEEFGRFIQGFFFLPNINPSRPSTLFSHRTSDNPILGQYTLKSQEIRTWRGGNLAEKRNHNLDHPGTLFCKHSHNTNLSIFGVD